MRKRSRKLLASGLAAAGVLWLAGGPSAGDGKTGKASAPPGLSRWIEGTAAPVAITPELRLRGEQLYAARCAICHGAKGDGKGGAARFLQTRPRDFTSGIFKFRTSAQDDMPADLDLFRSITSGFPIHGMPSFRYLPARDRWALVHRVKRFYPRWEKFGKPKLLQVGAPPQLAPGAAERGRQLYEKTFDCLQCHGPRGHGDGPRAKELVDHWKNPVSPRDFTLGPAFRKAGWTRADLVRILLTGIPSTPMPSFADQLKDPKDLTSLWEVAAHVERLIAEGRR